MHFLETWLYILASVLCCSCQGSGEDRGHDEQRFTVFVGEPMTFGEAHDYCGTNKYLLNLQAAVNVSHVSAMLQRHGLHSSYVWLNMRLVHGFFHWLDPVPQLFRQNASWPYGNKIISLSFHHECAVLNTSVGFIETRPCDDKHKFVCIYDNQQRLFDHSAEASSVELTPNQPPILLSRNLADLRLTCQAKLSNGTVLEEPGGYGYAYVWTKNGIFLDNTNSFLQPETVSELNAFTHLGPSKQGRYQCGMKVLPSGHTVWSQVITVVLEDFDSYRVTGHLHASVDPQPIQFAGSSFVSFARSIDNALNRQQPNDLAGWSYSGLTKDYMNRINISIFVYYQRAQPASLADSETRKESLSEALQDLLVITSITHVLNCGFLQEEKSTLSPKGIGGFLEYTPNCLTAFDVRTDTHHLLNGTWMEVWQLCNNMGGYLSSNEHGYWTGIVKKHGHLQSDSTGQPDVLEALQVSELLVPIVLPMVSAEDVCFYVSPAQSQNQSAEGAIMESSCSDTRQGKCEFTHRSFFRDLYPCPKGGWLDFSSRNTCLWLSLSPLNYTQAAEECRANKGHLAVIDNSSLSYTLTLLLTPSNGTPWLRVERRDRGQRMVLTCRVSAEIIPGSVLWYKDGIAVLGDRVRTADGNDIVLVIEKAAPENSYLQGYYWCEGVNVVDFRPVESKKLLVRFPGVKTYACSMSLNGRNPQLYAFSSNEALRFASNFRREFLYAIHDTTLEGYHNELQVVGVVQDTATDDAVRFFVFFRQLEQLSRMTKQEEEMDIIRSLRSAVINSTSSLITSPRVLPHKLKIKSTEMCFEDKTKLEETLTWPTTTIGRVAVPREACIQGDGQPVVRRCEGNFTTGAHWGNIQGICERTPSQTTVDLRNLSMAMVTNTTIAPTAERLRELTADSDNLGAQDVLYVATTLENIVSAGTIEIQTARNIASTIDHVMNVNRTALQQSRSGNSTNRILTAIEEASAALSTSTVIFSGSVAVGKVDIIEYNRGIAIHLRDNSTYHFSDPQSIPRGTDAAIILAEPNASIPHLTIALMPAGALFKEMCRNDTEHEVERNGTKLEVGKNDRNVGSTYEVCTQVLQVKYTIDDGTANLTSSNARFSFFFRQTCDILPTKIECVFWDINENEGLGSWSGDGCEYLNMVHDYHLCNCTHLTSFAVIFRYDKSQETTNVHDTVLSYLTSFGIAVSGLGLFFVILTYICYRKWRRSTGHQILFNLCLALVGALVSFVVMANIPKQLASLVSCTCVGVALHYFLLVSFSWTFIEALLQYLRFVRVLGTYVPNLVLKAAFGAWGVPMLVILCVLIINPMHYHKRKDFCWLEDKALLFSFLLPVAVILAANTIVFCVIVFNIYCRRQTGLRSTQSQVELAKAQLRATICIVFLLGLTWIFAYLSLIRSVSHEWGHLFEYLFVISSSLQGLVIFIFHIAYEKTAREFWFGHVVYRLWQSKEERTVDHGFKNTLSSSAVKTTST
ncbi:uncharacterized protein LOC119160896 isoform X3 [Rhipicephalus microplus]|uniref:uncharacterized protein LOC119160896 isoform X3 n=1 Tax=Rhipicephalus microplus TaxID=6941 RepID=UPI001888FA52|nr:uncharacterized protein LOC119160896 isoform X2 [Rhipicephalus microplus]